MSRALDDHTFVILNVEQKGDGNKTTYEVLYSLTPESVEPVYKTASIPIKDRKTLGTLLDFLRIKEKFPEQKSVADTTVDAPSLSNYADTHYSESPGQTGCLWPAVYMAVAGVLGYVLGGQLGDGGLGMKIGTAIAGSVLGYLEFRREANIAYKRDMEKLVSGRKSYLGQIEPDLIHMLVKYTPSKPAEAA